jgi:protease-4
MKQFFKMFFASMLAMMVSGVIIVAVIIGLVIGAVSKATSPKSETTTVADNSVLVIELDNTFHEQGESNSIPLFDDGGYSAGLYDAIKAIEYAQTDDKIKGILIKTESSPNGFATLQQLRAAIKDFKSVNKFVYAYGEDIPQNAYYVASVADSIYLNPVGGMELKGTATQLAFFKGTLDKLDLKPEIFYAGKFKSATEPLRSDRMSEPNRLQIAALQADVWQEFLKAAAEHANVPDSTIHNWANTGAVEFPEDALKLKLVDGLLYMDEVEKRIRTKAGTKEKDEIKYVKLGEYAERVRKRSESENERVAVLFAEGSIVDGENEDGDRMIASVDMAKEIRKLAKNDKVKAVVLRVNSGGGSALASEVILRELELLHKKKPLVVSMGDYAASGGYYIACQADSIFAMPNTITGSIGVFGVMFNVSEMMKNKLGVTVDIEKNAKYADFPTAMRPLTEDEAQRVQRSVDNIYTIFKSRVAKGRKMDIALVDSIAQGRVWTGKAALKNGLVDGLGGIDRAVASAASLAKLKDYQVITVPSPSDKFEKMMSRMGKFSSQAALQAAIQEETGVGYHYYKQMKKLYNMNGKTMMAMPFELTIQ